MHIVEAPEDVAGIVRDGDEFVPISQWWATREQYGVHSDDDDDIVERVDGSAVTISRRSDDVQYGGAIRI